MNYTTKEAKLFTQFKNWIKGDSDLIDELIQDAHSAFKAEVNPLLTLDFLHSSTDDITFRVKGSSITTDIVQGKRVNRNGRKSRGEEFHFDLDFEDLYFDHDLKNFYGSYKGKEIPILLETNSNSISPRILRVLGESESDLLRLIRHKHMRDCSTYLSRFYDPDAQNPIKEFNVSHAFFDKDLLIYRKGSKLYVKRGRAITTFTFQITERGFFTHVDIPFIDHEFEILKIKPKKATFEGFLTPLSCYRLAFFNWK